jgi:hypothetical protein
MDASIALLPNRRASSRFVNDRERAKGRNSARPAKTAFAARDVDKQRKSAKYQRHGLKTAISARHQRHSLQSPFFYPYRKACNSPGEGKSRNPPSAIRSSRQVRLHLDDGVEKFLSDRAAESNSLFFSIFPIDSSARLVYPR